MWLRSEECHIATYELLPIVSVDTALTDLISVPCSYDRQYDVLAYLDYSDLVPR